MLGGSAPPQTSGAPYRTESGSRAAEWPSPAHQSEICNRSCGVYSLFPGPGDTPKTLYTPTPKNSSNFQEFVRTQKVPDAFFSKFFFTSGAPHFDTSSHSGIRQEISRLEITPESFSEVSKPYSLNENNLEEQNVSARNEPKPKKLSNDIVIIKSEVEEGTKVESENMSVLDGHKTVEIKSLRNNKERKHDMLPTKNERTNARVGDILANEPDSTEFKNLNNTKTIQDITIAGIENLKKEPTTSGSEVVLSIATPIDCSDSCEIVTKEKCNIKVFDSINESGGKKKKIAELSVEVEPVNDIYIRLGEKKVPKTPDSNCKSSPASGRKLYNESSKPSPTRTLPLSPQNGGCSRTTPVTFKHMSQQEADSKSQNIHIEVPPLFIKKEPSDFQKNFNGSSFLSPAHLDNNFFSPNGLNVLDGQLLSPMPYSSSFESSNRQKESFLGSLNQTFISPNQTYLSPRLVTESPFLSPNVDIGRFGPYKNYSALPKIGENYLINENNDKVSEGVFLTSMGCLPPREDRQSENSRIFINSVETESKNKVPEKTACSKPNVTPCQVAEVTSASSLLSPNHSSVNPLVVKQETTTAASSSGLSVAGTYIDQNKETAFTTSGQSTLVSSTVGVPSPRQRCQQRLNEIKISSNNVSSPPVIHRSIPSPLVELPPSMGPTMFGGSLLSDRSANLITTWPTQAHNPTLWRYSAPIDYPPFPPVGFQLVRDPVTGHFLLIPASNIEALQRALLWPGYQSSPPQMIIPPLSVQPSTPHLIVDTNVPAVDFLTSKTIHHNVPQHRILIPADNSKRKVTTPTVIKVEASDSSSTVVVTTCDSNSIYSKTQPLTLSPRREPVIHSPRTSTSTETGRKSQATSPCLNPILESASDLSIPRDSDSCPLQITKMVTLQDASNQTDLHFETEAKECISSVVCKDKFKPYIKTTEQSLKLAKTQDVGTETVLIEEPEDDKGAVLREIQKKNEIEECLNISCNDVPVSLNIKKETVSPSQVDLSGLELLSNSIEQFVCDAECKSIDVNTENIVKNCASDEERKVLSSDACEGAVLLQNLKNGFREVEKSEAYENESSKNLGGLGLLCALAEQRFKEEIGKEIIRNEDLDHEEKKEEKKEEIVESILNDDLDFQRQRSVKECDSESTCQSEKDFPILKKEVEIENDENKSSGINKTIISNEQCKQNEDNFANFTPVVEKVSTKRGPGRPKKFKSIKKDNSVLDSFLYRKSKRDSKEMSPPVLEKEGDFFYNEKTDLLENSLTMNSKEDIPPTLTPSTILDPVIKTMAGTLALTPCEVNLIALRINKDKLKKNETKEGTNIYENEGRKRKLSDSGNPFSSSKKRKVGRPKKHNLLHQNSMTETIVAKKKKTKSYLFQPAQTVENGNCLKTKNNEGLSPDAMDLSGEEDKSKKIRPKLKAEAKLKEWTMQDDENLENTKAVKKEDNCKQKIKIQKKVAIEEKKFNENLKTSGTKESTLSSCLLTADHLNSDKFPIRTLTAMGGLFYAGQLSAIRAPDVYGITIDGERGNRPHIYSREEILKDSIFEVRPEKASDLLPGTRCCAYWSEQYRCLYPGTVSVPTSPDPELDDKFVNVEFDDGDSGRINIDDIRLLPKDYPIVEYDPNPLQSLSKRKRRISGASIESQSKERKSIDFLPSSDKNEIGNNKEYTKPELLSEESEPEKHIQVYESGSFLSLESERRHLKKKRREKLKRLQSLSSEGKKKHKKHKCSDEHRHHRHHKKHRKHKHKHGKKYNEEIKEDTKKNDEAVDGMSKDKKNYKNKYKSVKNSCKLSEKSKAIKPKKCKERTESVESRSKMAAFLPARQLWGWSGKGFRRPGAKGRARKEFYKTIQRGKERITVGDCAVFLSTGRPDRPYIGRIESMWESWGTNMIVRVKWFYHPEETVGCPATLEYPGALFESPHVDENDVQTISHKCEVLPLKEYTAVIGNDPQRYETIYDNNDIYYLAGYYDPTNTTLKMEPGVK